jgi:hypothetical protein
MRSLWPVAEAAQADYEALRGSVLAGAPRRSDVVARRFERSGLAGLIRAPAAEPDYLAVVIGAVRPAWCGREDPRFEVLRDVYAHLLAERAADAGAVAVTR